MPEEPNGVVLGLRIQGYRVRFPARAGHSLVTFWSCWDHTFIDFSYVFITVRTFFYNVGITFGLYWGNFFCRFGEMFGRVWGHFGEVFG